MGWTMAGNTTGTSAHRDSADQWVDSSLSDKSYSANQANAFATGNIFQITGIQLEVGDISDPVFEHRSYSEELILCQRYFQVVGNSSYFAGNGVGSATISVGIPLATPMRATPSVPSTGYKFHRSGNTNSGTNSVTSVTYATVGASNLQLRVNFGSGISDEGRVCFDAYYGRPTLSAVIDGLYRRRPELRGHSISDFHRNSSAVSFTLSQSVVSGEAILVIIGNIVQEPGVNKAYTAQGNTLTFSSAPANGDIIQVRFFGRAVDQPTSYAMKLFKYVATANQTAFTGADNNGAILAFSGNDVDVYLNGVHLDTSDFTCTNGDTITLGTGADDNELVVRAYRAFSVTDTVSKASGGTFAGEITTNVSLPDHEYHGGHGRVPHQRPDYQREHHHCRHKECPWHRATYDC